ncbi:hypothetical protein [Streptomyces sp. TM32]|uniref:hypothetical protein n=1 Tax=Streptomyces sp. TM32 TaxID=1652669 RepID=UPI0012ABDB62|nr:hypothetical protein [Streptomyces sp. TM32]
MSPLELRIFAYLAWASAANRPVTFREIGHLPLSTGDLVGVRAAVKTTRDLADTGLVALLGQTRILHAPLTVLVAGHQPKAPVASPPARQPLTQPKSKTPLLGRRPASSGHPTQAPSGLSRPTRCAAATPSLSKWCEAGIPYDSLSR